MAIFNSYVKLPEGTSSFYIVFSQSLIGAVWGVPVMTGECLAHAECVNTSCCSDGQLGSDERIRTEKSLNLQMTSIWLE